MESSRDVVIRALRTARSASDLLDFQTHQCYDTAFMQLATAIIAEAEIIMAHSQIEEVKNNARGLQKVAEEIRSLYPSGMGNNIVLMSSVQESLIESPSPEVVGDVVKALDLYTQAIWILRLGSSDAKKSFRGTLLSMAMAMVLDETAQYRQEFPVLHGNLDSIKKEERRLLLQMEEPSRHMREQRQAIENRIQQIDTRLAEIQAAQNQPDSLIELMFY